MTSGNDRRVSLVTGICIDRDAISNVVMAQRAMLIDAGYEVRVYAHHLDRGATSDLIQIADPWAIQLDAHFAASDLVIYHFGIEYELFNSLLLSHPRARRVVQFHNVTPPSLLDGPPRKAAEAGLAQLSLTANADRVWCDSRYNARSLAEHVDIDPARVRVLELGLAFEPSVPHRAPFGQADTIQILAVGRFVRAKGLLDLLDAVELVEPDIRAAVQMRLAGSTAHADPAYLAQVETRAENLDVELLFDLDDDDLAELYRSSNLFVSASHHEGFCLPVIEALAAGCRILTTDAGALPDTVDGCGTIVSAGDPSTMAAAITAEVRSLQRGDGDPAEVVAERLRVERTARHLSHFGAAATRRRFLHEVRAALAREPAGRAGAGGLRPSPNNPGSSPLTATERFANHQRRLLDRLVCPTCHRPPVVTSPVWITGALESGGLECPEHGLVGVVSSFTPSFLDRELDQVSVDGGQVLSVLDLQRDVTCLGAWTPVPQGILCLGGADDALVFDAAGMRATIEFLGHDHSGSVRIIVEDGDTLDVDLFRREPETVRVVLDDLGSERRRVHILPIGASPDGPAHATQVVVARVEVPAGLTDRSPADVTAINRGNPYPEQFRRLVDEMPADAMILDCGGGDRRYGDDRVYNMEYLHFELPDVFGDGMCLPFADDSFDLIMSQAVLEHVPDPQRAVDEMIRVLKSGGQIYIEIAFMQPLHAVPSHYMNVTPHGITHLCRDLEVLESGTFGGLAVTFEWIGQLAAAEARLGTERLTQVLEALRDLDEQMSPEELDQFASAVYLLGRKRRF